MFPFQPIQRHTNINLILILKRRHQIRTDHIRNLGDVGLDMLVPAVVADVSRTKLLLLYFGVLEVADLAGLVEGLWLGRSQ